MFKHKVIMLQRHWRTMCMVRETQRQVMQSWFFKFERATIRANVKALQMEEMNMKYAAKHEKGGKNRYVRVPEKKHANTSICRVNATLH